MHSTSPYAMRIYPSGVGCLLLGVAICTAYGVVSTSFWELTTKRSKEATSNGDTVLQTQPQLQPQVGSRPWVICLGDSLTQYGFDPERMGWLALLAHWWERRFDVLNRGFSGYNTRWMLPLAERFFAPAVQTPVALVMIFLGANDCVLPGFAQHVPLEEYKGNLEKIVSHVRTGYPGAKILLITPPPIHEGKWGAHRKEQGREMDRKQEVTMAYAAACREVAAEASLAVVNAYEVLGSGNEALADRHLHDGVHFTLDGNRALFKAVQEAIVTNFAELDPASNTAIGIQGPHWADVDPMNPRESVLRDL